VKGNIHNYFVKHHSDKNFEGDFKMMQQDFFINNISIVFGAQVFQQSDETPMGMICASLLVTYFDIL
jgi:hypothetical protein